MAYQAFTVYGRPFQIVLLAPEFSYLTQTGGSVCSNPAPVYKKLELDWLIVCHNPLLTFVYQLIQPVNYQMEVNKVWALPVSLATTPRISV